MACSTLTKDGVTFLICGRGLPQQPSCRYCANTSTKLCDFPVGNGKTCDAPICDAHASSVGPDRDLCPKHASEWKGVKP